MTTRRELNKMYKGREFTFFSPFVDHPGFADGDKGVIVKLLPIQDGEVKDLWMARNLSTGEEHPIWGGEAYVGNKPLIGEHQFTNWKPSKNLIQTSVRRAKLRSAEATHT